MYKRIIIFSLVSIFSGKLIANETVEGNNIHHAEKSKALLNKLEQRIIETLAEVSRIEAKRNGQVTTNYTINIPASTHTNSGLIFDPTENLNGLRVISVSQESPAYKAGIRPSDIIREINGQAISKTLTGKSKAEDYSSLFRSGKEIKVSFESNGTHKSAVFSMPQIKVPEANLAIDFNKLSEVNEKDEDECGHIVFNTPPHRELVYPLHILKVNDSNVHEEYIRRKFTPGKYRFEFARGSRAMYRVSEDISRYGRGRMPFEINIEANTKYYIGAVRINGRLSDSKNEAQDKVTGSHIKRPQSTMAWKPTILKTEVQTCRL